MISILRKNDIKSKYCDKRECQQIKNVVFSDVLFVKCIIIYSLAGYT